MKYQVVYIPKIEDEVVLSEYESYREAEIHLEQILVTKPEVHKFHYIKEIHKVLRLRYTGEQS